MTEKVRPIVEDSRPIVQVVARGEDGRCWNVGHAGVTKIVAYREHGQDGSIPWLGVYVDGLFTTRINCAEVESIGYINTTIAEPEEESATLALLSHLYFALHQVSIDATNDVKSPSGLDEGEVQFYKLTGEIREHLQAHGDPFVVEQMGITLRSIANELPF